ncbi:MAG: OadG family protein [Clostridia bacterium]|nr:OadG family protein [Clostridia bacterium]
MQTLTFGLQVTVLGMSVVFIALIFLILVINLMTKGTEFSKAKKGAAGAEPIKKEAVAAAASPSEEDEGEVIAVLAAAIACLQPGKKMRLKTIQRLEGETVPIWSAAGRQETMYGRQAR